MLIKDLIFTDETIIETGTLYTCHIKNVGRITVLHRMTGFDWFDTETGFRDSKDKFWLVSGNFDIRQYPDLTIEEAIAKIKQYANTCVGE